MLLRDHFFLILFAPRAYIVDSLRRDVLTCFGSARFSGPTSRLLITFTTSFSCAVPRDAAFWYGKRLFVSRAGGCNYAIELIISLGLTATPSEPLALSARLTYWSFAKNHSRQTVRLMASGGSGRRWSDWQSSSASLSLESLLRDALVSLALRIVSELKEKKLPLRGRRGDKPSSSREAMLKAARDVHSSHSRMICFSHSSASLLVVVAFFFRLSLSLPSVALDALIRLRASLWPGSRRS